METKLLSLWLAISEVTDQINEQAHKFIRKADELTETEPVNSINLRAQGIGLLEANQILGKVLRDRDLLP